MKCYVENIETGKTTSVDLVHDIEDLLVGQYSDCHLFIKDGKYHYFFYFPLDLVTESDDYLVDATIDYWLDQCDGKARVSTAYVTESECADKTPDETVKLAEHLSEQERAQRRDEMTKSIRHIQLLIMDKGLDCIKRKADFYEHCARHIEANRPLIRGLDCGIFA